MGHAHTRAMHKGLTREQQTVVGHGRVEAIDPGHLLATLGHHGIFLHVHMDAVAAAIFGQETGSVSIAQDIRHRIVVVGEDGHAEAGGDLELATIPEKGEVLDHVAQPFDELHGLVQPCVVKQNAELVTTESGQDVAATNLGRQHTG